MEVRVKKRIADLVKIGVLVPALIVSMAACGAASAQDNGGGEAAGAADTTVAENTGDTAEEMTEEKTGEKTEETATQPAEGKVYENKGRARSMRTRAIRSPFLQNLRTRSR